MEVNYVAVLVAGIVSMVVGALWYSPMLFGKMWMTLSGMSETDAKAMKGKGMGQTYAAALLVQLVMAYVFYQFLDLGAGYAGAFQTAFWLWLGFIATVMLGTVLWERKPVQLYMLNIAYWLVNLFVMGSVLVMMA
jgi:hypothetical protein